MTTTAQPTAQTPTRPGQRAGGSPEYRHHAVGAPDVARTAPGGKPRNSWSPCRAPSASSSGACWTANTTARWLLEVGDEVRASLNRRNGTRMPWSAPPKGWTSTTWQTCWSISPRPSARRSSTDMDQQYRSRLEAVLTYDGGHRRRVDGHQRDHGAGGRHAGGGAPVPAPARQHPESHRCADGGGPFRTLPRRAAHLRPAAARPGHAGGRGHGTRPAADPGGHARRHGRGDLRGPRPCVGGRGGREQPAAWAHHGGRRGGCDPRRRRGSPAQLRGG